MGTPNESDAFLIDATINMAGAEGDVHASFQRISRHIEGQKVKMEIDPQVDADKMAREIAQITQELKKVSTAVAEAEAEMKRLQEAADKTKKSIDSIAPGAADRLSAAIAKGTDAARNELQALQKEIEETQQAALGKHERRFSRMAGDVSSPAFKRALQKMHGLSDNATPEVVAEAVIMRAHKRTKSYKALREEAAAAPEGSGLRSALERNVRIERRRAVQATREAYEFFGGRDAAQAPIAEFRKLFQGRRRGAAGVTEALQGYFASLSSVNRVAGALGEHQARGTSLAQSLAAATQRMQQTERRTSAAAGGGGSVGPFDLNINIPHLISQISTAFEHEYNLKINSAALQAQIVALLGTLDKKPGAERAGAATEKTSRAARRDEERQLMVDKRYAQFLGHSGAGSEAFLGQLGSFYGVNVSEIQKLAGTLSAWKAAQEGSPEAAHAARSALNSSGAFHEALRAFEYNKEAPAGAKELLKSWATGFISEHLTPLHGAYSSAREHGANPNAKGQLAAVHQLAAEDERPAQAARARRVWERMQHFLGFTSNMGDGAQRDRLKESLAAYREYTRARMRFEEELHRYNIALNDEERAALEKRVEAARAAFSASESTLRYHLLPGQVDVPTPLGGTQRMDAASAYAGIQKQMLGRFGGAYAGTASLMGGTNVLTFQDFLSGMFGGNEHIQRAYVKSTTGQDVTDQKVLNELVEKELADLRQVYEIQKQIDGALKQQVQHVARLATTGGGRGRAPGKPSMAGYWETIRNGAALFGGIGLGYTVANHIQQQMRTVMTYQQELAEIQGVLRSKSPLDAQTIGAGVGRISGKYGTDLLETAQAAKELAQSGLEANRIVEELDKTMQAVKGMGMTIEQAKELEIAIRSVTEANDKYGHSIDWTRAAFEKISTIEARYAVTAQDLASGLKIALPVIDQYSDGIMGMANALDYTNAMQTVMIEKMRITGSQAGNSLKFIFSRISRPETLKKIQQDFGLRLGTEDGTDFLPMDQLIRAMGEKYNSLVSSGQGYKAKAFATELAGGRQVNTLITLLENYRRVSDIATESAFAFGTTQERATIASETLATAVGRLRTNFSLLLNNTGQSSKFFAGLIGILNSVANLFGSGASSGAGSFTAILGILAGGALIRGIQKTYGILQAAKAGAIVTNAAEAASLGAVTAESAAATTGLGALAVAETEAAAAGGVLTSVLGGAASIFTTGGVILAALTAAVIGLGFAYDKSGEAVDRYKVKVKSIDELGLENAPQMEDFRGMASKYNLGTIKNAFDTITGITFGYPDMGTAGTTPEMSAVLNKALEQSFSDNPKNVAKIRKEWADLFIQALPEDAYKGFSAIKTESGKVAEAVHLLGNAAFAANAQMAASIDAVRESTKRMVEDTVEGLAKIDRAKSRSGVFARISGAIDDVFSKRAVLDQHYEVAPGHEVPAWMQRAIANSISESPLFANFLKRSPEARQYLNQTIAGFAGRPGGFVTGEVLTSFFTGVQNTTPLMNALVKSAAIDVGQQDVARQYDAGVNFSAQLSPAEAAQRAGKDLATNVAAKVTADTEKMTKDRNPLADNLMRLYKLFSENGVDTTGLLGDSKGASEALVEFKDTLLDVTKKIYEAVHKFAFDQAFAQRNGTGFDRDQRLFELGRTLMEQGDSYESDRLFQIVGLRRKAIYLDSVAKDKGTPRTDTERARISKEIESLQSQVAQFATTDFSKVFGNSDEGKKLTQFMRQGLAQVMQQGGTPEAIAAFFKQVPQQMLDAAREGLNADKARKDMLELQKQTIEQQSQLLDAQLPITAKLADHMRIRMQASAETYKTELALLDVDRDTMGEDAYQLAVKKLQVETQLKTTIQEQIELAKQQQQVDQQTMQNLQAAMRPVMQLLTDPSVLGNTVGWEKPWKERAEAIRLLFMQTFSQISKAFSDRVFENMTQTVSEKLFSMAGIKGLASSPETRMKSALADGSAMLATGIVGASAQGGAIIAGYIATALTTGKVATGGAGMGILPVPGLASMPGVSMPSAGGVSIGMTATGGISTAAAAAVVARNQAKTQKDAADALAQKAHDDARAQMIAGMGLMAGQMAGTLAGRGGQYAQMGSQIGSVAGMGGAALLGMKFGAAGGPVGLAVGAAIGGLLGGLFGGSKDKKPQDNPVIKALDAIERAQKETITTIQAQTDALLKPESRLLNLPSMFNIPSYAPAFAGAGGYGSGGTQRLEVALTVDGSAPKELHAMVADKVGEVIDSKLGDLLYSSARNSRR